MFTFVRRLREYLHVHRYNKPIVSMYWTFSTRKIIYQCRCGDRISRMVYIPFGGGDFPIETTSLLTNKDYEEILNRKKTFDCDHTKDGFFEPKYARQEGFRRCVYCKKYPSYALYSTGWLGGRTYYCSDCNKIYMSNENKK